MIFCLHLLIHPSRDISPLLTVPQKPKGYNPALPREVCHRAARGFLG